MTHYTPLSAFLTEYSERNTGNAHKPVAVGRYGIRTRESIYSKELAKDYSKNKLIHKNTLTVGMGSVQIDIGILTDDVTYSVSPAYHTYRIDGINADYLRYCLECRNQDMFVRFVKRGSRQGKTIDLKRWLTYEIPVRDDAEQQEIVAMLDRVSALIEQRQQQIEQIDALVKSRFIEMFGEPKSNSKCLATKRVIDIVTLQRGFDLPVQNRNADGSIPVYGSNGILGYHDEAKCNAGVITGRSGTLGEVLSCDKPFWPLNTTLFSVNTHGNNIVYLRYLLELYDLKRFGTGTGVPTLNRNEFHDKQIIAVPIELQNEFATFVEQVDKSKLAVQQGLQELEILKKSLMQQYFG